MQRGIGRYSLALALGMARQRAGHDLRIVLNEFYADSVATIRQGFDALLPQSHISTFAAPMPTSEVDRRNHWRLHAAERIREHALASLRPDVVHVGSLFEGLSENVVTSVPRSENRFDTAVTLYDLIPLIRSERYMGDPNFAAWYHRKLEHLKASPLLLAISNSARLEAIEFLGLAPERVINISSAVDAIFRPLALGQDERAALLARLGLRRPFVMYTGGIDFRKNIEGLIEAFADLAPALRGQYQLAVVCNVHEADRRRLTRHAAKCGMAEDDLVLTGFVSDADLVALYNCTALFVFPSLHEGFGLPVLEAMACGAPVIGSNSSSIPEVIGRADALFDPTRVNSISASMAQVLLDPARQAALRTHGLAQAKCFSWDASARRAIEAFEETHARRTAAGRVAVAPGMAPNIARRPRLAWVATQSSLPPDLAHYYDIELVLLQDGPDVNQALGRRSIAWFGDNADTFDRIVYRFGNSAAHAPMFSLLERHPGVVVLDDFFLGNAVSHAKTADSLAHDFGRALYLAHGYGALAEEQQQGRARSCQTYPCNKAVLDRAMGVIASSPDMPTLADAWYGPACSADWRVLAPDADAAQFYDALEHLAGAGQDRRTLLASLAMLGPNVPQPDLLQTAAAIAANRPRTGRRQLLVDVGAGLDAGAMDALRALLLMPPAGWRVEPVRHDGVRYRYARRFALDLIGRTDLALDDAVADAGFGDALVAAGVAPAPALPDAWRARGVTQSVVTEPGEAP